jgi:uncharacterized SAM-binding protein YcdF (DUF218 family)
MSPAAASATRPKQPLFFRRVTLLVPTWRGWLLLFVIAVCVVVPTVRALHPFLAINRQVPASVLVVEGWLPDDSLAAAAAAFRDGAYQWIVTSGGPIEKGRVLLEFNSYAELAAATLVRLGVPTNCLLVAPAPRASRNRTYQSALEVRRVLEQKKIPLNGLNVVSQGTHARRTLLVYRKVLGTDARVGVIATPPLDYDEGHWWRESEGVKQTLMEFMGWTWEAMFDSGR